jgi:arylsulfatase A-like enzyme
MTDPLGTPHAQNVLFIMCDQLRLDALSCHGAMVETPNIDALAARGVRFEQAHVQGAVCGSSRMSFYTGRYVQSHGSRFNRIPLQIGQRTIGDHLRTLGVNSTLVGKTHMVADREAMGWLGLDPNAPEVMYLAECGFDAEERDDGLQPAAGRVDLPYNEFLRENGYAGANPWHTAANSVVDSSGTRRSGWLLNASPYPAIVPDELSETAYMTDRAIDFIRRAGDERWCLHLSYIKPHWPYVVSSPYNDMVNAKDLSEPNRSTEERDNSHPVLNAFWDSRIGRTFSRADVRAAVVPAYLGLVQQLDHHLGRLFAELDRLGRSDDTLIVFTSDHGDYLGDHWMGDKYWLHDEIVKVPMIVVDPRAEADATRGSASTTLVEAIDLAPTFIEALGGDPADFALWLEGESLCPVLRGEQRDSTADIAICETDYAYVELDLPSSPAFGRRRQRATMLRTERFKYILDETGPNLLYDLEADPNEHVDRSGDPALSAIQAELHDRLFEWFRGRSHEVTGEPSRWAGTLRDGAVAQAGVFIGYWDESEAAAVGADHLLNGE